MEPGFYDERQHFDNRVKPLKVRAGGYIGQFVFS
jgi:hypothetical protein